MAKKMVVKLNDVLSKRGITQKELAQKAGIRENTVSDLLNNSGKGARFKTIEKIANALEIDDISDIVDFVQENEDENNGEGQDDCRCK